MFYTSGTLFRKWRKNIIIYIQRAETQLKQAVSPQKENSTFVKNVQLDD